MTRAISPSGEETAFDRGREHADARRFASARRAFAQAIRQGVKASWACQELVRTYIATNRARDAEPMLRELLGEGTPLLDHGLGYLYRRTGRVPEAREHFERAARARPKFWPASNELGWLEHRAGRTREGVKMLRAAARHFASRGDTWGEATAVTHLATIAREQFNLTVALELLERAESLKRTCGDQLGLATVLYARAQVHHFRMELIAARSMYEAALAIQRTIMFSEGIAASLNGLGLVHLDLADPDEAVSAFAGALRRYQGLGANYSAQQAVAHGNIGAACERKGDMRAMTLAMRRALASLDATSAPVDARELATYRLGLVWMLRGRPTKAVEVIDGVSPGTPRGRLALGQLRAECLLALHQPSRAVDLARSELRRAPSDTSKSTLLAERERLRAVLGRALMATGNRRAGLRCLDQATGAVVRLVSEQIGRDARLGLTDALRDIDNQLVLALVYEGSPIALKAWAASRQCKSSALAAQLKSGTRVAASNAKRLTVVEQEIRSVAADQKMPEGSLRRLAELKQRYREALNSVSADAVPRPPRDTRTGSLNLALPRDVAIVEFHSCAETTIAFTARAGQVVATDLGVARHDLVRLVDSLVRPLRGVLTARDTTPCLLAFDVHLAHRLYRELIAPALRGVGDDVHRLIIVPDGPLHGLPFGLLVTSLGPPRASDPFAWYGGHEYLASRYLLSQVQSSTLLRQARPRSPNPRSLVVAYAPERPTVLCIEDGLRTVGPLPHLAAEVEAVAQSLPNPTVLVGARATPEAYCRNSRSAEIIHIAAHAFRDPGIPDLSGLVLSSDARQGEVDFLTARRISTVSLDASVVTLSACDTAGGRTWQREGTLGLARAFHEAGATTVLASPWAVDDHAGATLLASFHEAWQSERDASLALHRGQESVRSLGGEHAHPYFWASFILSDYLLPSKATGRPGPS